MSEIKLRDLAAKLNIPAKELVEVAKSIGLDVKGVFDFLNEDQVAKLQHRIENKPQKSPQTKEAPTRRRRISRNTETQSKTAKEIRQKKEAAKQEQIEKETTKKTQNPTETKKLETTDVPQTQEQPKPEPQVVKKVVEKTTNKTAPEQPQVEDSPTPKYQPAPRRQIEIVNSAKDRENWLAGRKNVKKTSDKKYNNQFDDHASELRRKRKKVKKSKEKIQEEEVVKHTFNPRKGSIKIGATITVSELSSAIGIRASDIIKKLMDLGVLATINQSISGEEAALIASEFQVEVEIEAKDLEDVLTSQATGEAMTRAPVVTIMGHVDHGKTSLLDYIRKSQVVRKEAGGITQHMGAYRIYTDAGEMTLLDTPGHEAFTAMRARGANVTDIVILVVAANDGVQPQTVEAIHHAQAANAEMIVAVNKIDLPDADPQKVRQELLSHELIAEEFGGKTTFVNVSAITGEGVDQLMDMIHLHAEVLELKAKVEGLAQGNIIESHLKKGKGPVATVIVEEGTLKVGDCFVAGQTYGKIRAMTNSRGKNLLEATPSMPAEISGLNRVADVGSRLHVLNDDKIARQIAERRITRSREEAAVKQRKMQLENLFSSIEVEEFVELKLLIKTDVQGSAEALEETFAQLGNENASIRVIHSASGNITENDVMLASASDAIIIAFDVGMEATAKKVNLDEGVAIRYYKVIYEALEDVKLALQGMLKPQVKEEVIGRCVVREIFNAIKSRQIVGCYVQDGKITKDACIRLMRGDKECYNGPLSSLKRFKDDVKEVGNHYECGISFESNDVQVGDTIEVYTFVEESVTL